MSNCSNLIGKRKQLIRFFTTILLVIYFYLSALGQQIQFETVSAIDGLSQNSVVSVAQDSMGFIWFATQDGLNRYDGSNFQKYEVFFKDITEKDFSQLGKLSVDSKSKIWMTTLSGGLQYFSQKENKFKTVDGIEDASYIYHQDASHHWVADFKAGLYQLTITEQDHILKNIIPNIYISKIIQDDQLLLLTDRGVIRFDPDTGNQSRLFESLGHISDLLISEYGEYLIATHDDKIYHSKDGSSYSLYLQLPNGGIIQDVHKDSKERLWIATYGEGVFLYDEKELIQFKTDPLNPKALCYSDVLCIYEDLDKNIWFGTDGGGVSYIAGDRKPIHSLVNHMLPKTVPVDVSRAISKDKSGYTWIGTSGKGLSVVSKDLKTTKHFNTQNSPLVSDRIMSLYHDDEDNMWVGTQTAGLLRFTAQGKNIKQVNSKLPAKTIWDIEQADEDHLWLCTRKNGLIILDKDEWTWEKPVLPEQIAYLDSSNVRVIASGADETFFIGTESGKIFKIEDNEIDSEIKIKNLETGPIKSIYVDQNKLWIGTLQSGLVIVDLQSGQQWHIDKSKGLPNNVVYSILPQDESTVWISSNFGICQIDKEKLLQEESGFVKQHLTINNGLVSNEFNTGAYYMDQDGVMYFGGIDGINWFDPERILKDVKPADIVLLDLITTNKEGQEVIDISSKSEVDLRYPIRNFQLRYVAQSFSSSSKTRYKYMLEGINEEWVDNESNELVSFSNVSPGNYTFKLRSTNNDGVWSTVPLKLSINVIPAFWETTWFQALVVLVSLGLLWLIYHLRVKELKRANELKEQLAQVEAKALKLQMNPHFLFNSLNAIDNYILKNEKIKASDYLSKFSKLMRQVLDYSEVSYISLTQELKTLELYINMERLRFQERFQYKINIEESVDTNLVKVPPLVLQPIVENAIWHGLMHLDEGGVLKIDIVKSENNIKCIIDDNGIGRKKAEEINSKSATKHKSFGMRITEKRLSLNRDLHKIGASINVVDKQHPNGDSAGTAVEINFPVQA